MWYEIGVGVGGLVAVYILVCTFFLAGTPRKVQNYEKKHVLITGGSAGLGLALAVKCAQRGANLTVIARNQVKLKEAQSAIEKARKNPNQKVIALSADVSDWKQTETAVKKAIEENGPVDVLFANAGSSRPGYFLHQRVEDFAKEMNLNYMGTVHAIKASLPSMVERNSGHICIISSAAALAPIIGYVNYTATKTALKALADGLRNELLLYNIDVSIFFPTNIDTESFAEEQKIKPPETKEIEPGDPMKPDYCADLLLNGLSKGQFYILSELWPGQPLRMLCNGVMAPRSNFIIDLLAAPFVTFIAPGVRIWIDYVVLSSRKNHKKKD